jgi:hypothetical protein
MGYEGETAVAQTAILAALNSLPRITIVPTSRATSTPKPAPRFGGLWMT